MNAVYFEIEIENAAFGADAKERMGGCPGFCVNGLSFKPATADLRIQ